MDLESIGLAACGLEVPNLDACTIDPNELRELGLVFQKLGNYCRLKAFAMKQRLAGNIPQARFNEQECDRIYKQLPNWAKW